MKKVICLVGPTAIGKTSLSIKLAHKYHMEIISGDSIQVYRTLNIGSGKITEEEKEGIKHHLIDILDPSEPYSVSDFQKSSRKLIDDISLSNSIPFIVGGTGYYINACLNNYQFDCNKRTDEFDNFSNEELYNKLLELKDDQIPDINNRKRLLRHLEILSFGEKPNKRNEKLYDYLIIGLTAPREIIYERINNRVDKMIEDGLVLEAKSLFDLNIESNATLAIGYKELFPYFNNLESLDSCIDKIKQHSRNFAKRQLTYFNNQLKVNWIDITKENPYDKSIELIEDFLNE